jgi:hypothetical protein
MEQVRDAVVRQLQKHQVDALAAFPAQQVKAYQSPVAAVGLRRAEVCDPGFVRYLGLRDDENTGAAVEVYGKTMQLALSVDVYAPRIVGESGCIAAAASVQEALFLPTDVGVRITQLCWEQPVFDKAYNMFLRRGLADCCANLIAVSDDGSPIFSDFILKGVVSNHEQHYP